jgi:hypothetical protein
MWWLHAAATKFIRHSNPRVANSDSITCANPMCLYWRGRVGAALVERTSRVRIVKHVLISKQHCCESARPYSTDRLQPIMRDQRYATPLDKDEGTRYVAGLGVTLGQCKFGLTCYVGRLLHFPPLRICHNQSVIVPRPFRRVQSVAALSCLWRGTEKRREFTGPRGGSTLGLLQPMRCMPHLQTRS